MTEFELLVRHLALFPMASQLPLYLRPSDAALDIALARLRQTLPTSHVPPPRSIALWIVALYHSRRELGGTTQGNLSQILSHDAPLSPSTSSSPAALSQQPQQQQQQQQPRQFATPLSTSRVDGHHQAPPSPVGANAPPAAAELSLLLATVLDGPFLMDALSSVVDALIVGATSGPELRCFGWLLAHVASGSPLVSSRVWALGAIARGASIFLGSRDPEPRQRVLAAARGALGDKILVAHPLAREAALHAALVLSPTPDDEHHPGLSLPPASPVPSKDHQASQQSPRGDPFATWQAILDGLTKAPGTHEDAWRYAEAAGVLQTLRDPNGRAALCLALHLADAPSIFEPLLDLIVATGTLGASQAAAIRLRPFTRYLLFETVDTSTLESFAQGGIHAVQGALEAWERVSSQTTVMTRAVFLHHALFVDGKEGSAASLSRHPELPLHCRLHLALLDPAQRVLLCGELAALFAVAPQRHALRIAIAASAWLALQITEQEKSVEIIAEAALSAEAEALALALAKMMAVGQAQVSEEISRSAKDLLGGRLGCLLLTMVWASTPMALSISPRALNTLIRALVDLSGGINFSTFPLPSSSPSISPGSLERDLSGALIIYIVRLRTRDGISMGKSVALLDPEFEGFLNTSLKGDKALHALALSTLD